ncbi:MAG: DNA recombination protein RmuC [Bacteroidales bacterium]|nr:DNA recombination protein RmuC [Bacteroidales bacterium]
MKKALSDNEINNVKTTTELKSQLELAVKEMSARTADIGAKADSLSEALTGRPKVQGCWGENLLDDILSKEGFERGLHYDREVTGEDLSRPDFVFHFYDGMEKKDLVVDSKVSLTAFVEYMNADSEEDRKTALDKHLKSVKKHIDELSGKNYASKIDKSKRFADYVIMFMPVDMAYRAAIDADYTLWQYAYSKGVVIATEQTIMPFMKVIRLTWNKYSQDSNVMEIMQAADAIVERVGLFYDSYKELGRRLKAVYGEYNKGIIKLEDKGPSITTSARKLIKLGAKRAQGKELLVPEEHLLLSEEEEIGL